MKKKKYKDGLLSPDEYWEKKLGINFKAELTRYKKLCGIISKKDYRLLDGHYYISHHDWESHIKNVIECLV